MIDDVFRDALRLLTNIESATEAHLSQISALAATRRATVIDLVAVAKAHGVRNPQQYVAERLGISQQTVSKIINRK